MTSKIKRSFQSTWKAILKLISKEAISTNMQSNGKDLEINYNYLEKVLTLRRIEGRNAISFTISNPIEIGMINRKLLAQSTVDVPFLKGT